MPPETPPDATPKDSAEARFIANVREQQQRTEAILADLAGTIEDARADLSTKLGISHDRLGERLAAIEAGLDKITESLALLHPSEFDERLGTIEADLSRLLALAEQAEKFLHNPIGAYKAARLGKLPGK